MFRPLAGYFALLTLSLLVGGVKSLKRGRDWQVIGLGILLQVGVVFAMMNSAVVVSFFEGIAQGIMRVRDATIEGTRFVFGYVGGGASPFPLNEGSSTFILAFQALPTVILFGILAAILTYLNILPILAKIVGYAFRKVFKINESVGMVAAARIFIGQLESPLLIKHQLASLSKADIFIILALSFSTAAASIMPICASAIEAICPDAMKHIIMSSVISVISALIVCSTMGPIEGPEDGSVPIDGEAVEDQKPYSSFMGALSRGLSDGCFVWWCIVGSMIGMVALIALVNQILAIFSGGDGNPLTLQRIFGFIMYPFAWIIGIRDADLLAISQILGTKLAVNEIVAYFDLAKCSVARDSVVKAIYAITNFGNFSCIGVTVGGMMALAPTQKCIPTIIGKAFIAGLLATGLSATIVGVFLSF
jgi:CNT family concentrative nucleoside transporter